MKAVPSFSGYIPSRMPQTLGPYEILGPLGAGGFGTVYRARQGGLDREVALKVLNDGAAESRDVVARFKREMRLSASLSHPNLVKVYDGGYHDGVAFIAMELVEGPTLEDRLNEGVLLPLEETIRIATAIARALAYLHSREILHRDLKPANVLLGTEVKVADFGLARRMNATQLTAENVLLGTLIYLAPECLQFGQSTRASDLWAFGGILYWMLTGLQHVTGESYSQLLVAINSDRIVPPSELNPAIPVLLSDVVMSMLERDPFKRLSSVQNVEQLLESLQPARPALRPLTAVREAFPRLHRAGLAAALTALTAGLALVGATLTHRPAPEKSPSPVARVLQGPSPVPRATLQPESEIKGAYFDRWKRIASDVDAVAQGRPPPSMLSRWQRLTGLSLSARGWAYWVKLGRWLEARGEGDPPDLKQMEFDELALQPLKDLKGPIGAEFYQTAIAMMPGAGTNGPMWLILGYLLELDGLKAESTIAYRRAFALKGRLSPGWKVPIELDALNRAVQSPATADPAKEYWEWTGPSPRQDLLVPKLISDIKPKAPQVYAAILERGIENDATMSLCAQLLADYYSVDCHDMGRALRVAEAAVKRNPTIIPLRSYAAGFMALQGRGREALSMALRLPRSDVNRRMITLASTRADDGSPDSKFTDEDWSRDRTVAIEIVRLLKTNREKAFELAREAQRRGLLESPLWGFTRLALVGAGFHDPVLSHFLEMIVRSWDFLAGSAMVGGLLTDEGRPLLEKLLSMDWDPKTNAVYITALRSLYLSRTGQHGLAMQELRKVVTDSDMAKRVEAIVLEVATRPALTALAENKEYTEKLPTEWVVSDRARAIFSALLKRDPQRLFAVAERELDRDGHWIIWGRICVYALAAQKNKELLLEYQERIRFLDAFLGGLGWIVKEVDELVASRKWR
jgi:serine/threonine protein kinase